ncbi:MAG: futalosine hydrolase [Deltaproteobacteria bacterium]
MELHAFPGQVRRNDRVKTLTCGVGPVESTLSLTRLLSGSNASEVTAVVNFGVGGAYPGSDLSILDLCFADREVLADLAICTEEGFLDLPASLTVVRDFSLDNALLAAAENFCRQKGCAFRKGSFATVCCASGSAQRGQTLRNKYQAVCENMEGAALARVCKEFGVPFLEVRAISNMVENRDLTGWQLEAAAARAAILAAEFALFLLGEKSTW